jgi:flagellar motility protein MotE (MotC chaperone)
VARDDGAQLAERDGVTRTDTWKRVRWGIGALLVAKLVTLLVPWGADSVGAARTALAEDAPAAPALAVVKPPVVAEGPTAGARDARSPAGASAAGGEVKSMLEALSRRQAELDQREKTLAAREEKLALYEKDVTEKIVQLEQVGNTLKEELKRSTSASDEAAQSLAKVYGAMKPAEAAPILDQLDEATTLRILTRMKEKQVGEILPLMTRERAIVLTRSLAGRVMAPAPQPKG